MILKNDPVIIKKAVEDFLKEPIRDSWGFSNKICLNCLKRAGHNLQWCPDCGKEMVKFDKSKMPFNNREYIERAKTSADSFERLANEILFGWEIEDLSYNRKIEKIKEAWLSIKAEAQDNA